MARTPSGDLEDALLTAAEQILTDEGPDALTVRKVATCAGVAPMGVYNRFQGKHGLLEALFIRGFDGLTGTVAEATGPDALHRLRSGLMHYRRFAISHPEHYRLMFERMREVEPSEAALLHAFESFDQLVGMVRSAQDLTAFGVGTEVEVAQQLWGALHGAISLELLGIGFDTDPARTYERMVDALLAGMQN